MEKWRRGETDRDGKPVVPPPYADALEELSSGQFRRLLVYLRLDSLPSLFTFITLLGADKEALQQQQQQQLSDVPEEPKDAGDSSSSSSSSRPLEVHGLRILELTERTSSVMRVTEGEEYYSERDPVVNAFRAFSRLNDVAVSGRVAVVPTASYAETLMKQAADVASDFVLVPWSEYGSMAEDPSVLDVPHPAADRFAGRAHLDFVAGVLAAAGPVCNTGVFINRDLGGASSSPHNGGGGSSLTRTRSILSVHSQARRDAAAAAAAATPPVKDKTHQVFFPFFGGVDDRVALRFALRLAKNPAVTLTVAHFSWTSSSAADSGDEVDAPGKAVLSTSSAAAAAAHHGAEEHDVGGGAKESVKVVEETSAQDAALLASLSSSLPRELAGRVLVTEVACEGGAGRAAVVAEAVARARMAVGNVPRNAGDIVVVGRTHAPLGDGEVEVGGGGSGGGGGGGGNELLRRTVGVVAEQLLDSGVKASLLVIKAGGAGLNW